MSLGKRLKEARLTKNITQEDLAKLVDISRVVLVKYENDHTVPNAITLVRIAELLDSNVRYLVYGEETNGNSLSLDECYDRVGELSIKEQSTIRSLLNFLIIPF